MDNSGQKFEVKFVPPPKQTEPNQSKKRNRKRNITWFNPPFSLSVSTCTGKRFLSLIDKCFPPSNPLHKILNRNTVKVSYRTTPNMKTLIKQHNQKLINNQTKPDIAPKECNCQKKPECPLQGKCLTDEVVYQATVIETNKQTHIETSETYIGMTKDPFKTRYRNHTKSFRLRKYETETKLSEHIWEIKDRGNDFSVQWKIIDRGKRYSPVSGICQLCTREKYYLIFKSELCSLNKRNELGAHCRHKTGLLLGKTET